MTYKDTEESQAEFFINNLSCHFPNIMERIQAEIGNKLIEKEQGIDVLIEFS